MRLTKYIIIFILSILLLHPISCSSGIRADDVENKGSYGLETLDAIADSILYGSDLEKMQEISERLYNKGVDGASKQEMVYGSTLLGITYLYDYHIDSCVYWLNNSILIDEMMKDKGMPPCDRIMAITYNNLGLCYINLTVDYYKASEYFLEALKRTDKHINPRLYTAILTNLSIVHYFRNDPAGIEYAKTCYEFEKERGVLSFMPNYSMALMEYVNQNYSEAREYAAYLMTLLDGEDDSAYARRDAIQTYNIYGKILLELGDDPGAKAAFEKAISIPAEDFKSDLAGAYLSYGDYYVRKGEWKEALAVLLKGVDMSYDQSNFVHLHELNKKIANIYEIIGESGKALEYYKIYQSLSDSITNISREFALYEAKAKYQLGQYENLLKERQIIILKKGKMEQLYISLSIILLCIFFGTWYYLRKRNRHYERIVRQYRENADLSRRIRESGGEERYNASALSETKNSLLFAELSRIMEEEKAYRDGTLTVDKLSARLQTNRSYLSRVINEQTGLNFNKYINKFRITEAIGMLSDKSNPDIQMKKIGYTLGFNSPSTFYKAFSEETGMSPSTFRRKIMESEG